MELLPPQQTIAPKHWWPWEMRYTRLWIRDGQTIKIHCSVIKKKITINYRLIDKRVFQKRENKSAVQIVAARECSCPSSELQPPPRPKKKNGAHVQFTPGCLQTLPARGYRLQFSAKPPSFNGIMFWEGSREAAKLWRAMRASDCLWFFAWHRSGRGSRKHGGSPGL